MLELKVEFQSKIDRVTEIKTCCVQKHKYTVLWCKMQNVMSEMLMLQHRAQNVETLCQNIMLKI